MPNLPAKVKECRPDTSYQSGNIYHDGAWGMDICKALLLKLHVY